MIINIAHDLKTPITAVKGYSEGILDGVADTPEKQERFNREIAYFQSKWEKELGAGDPYYNRNQTLHRADYTMDY